MANKLFKVLLRQGHEETVRFVIDKYHNNGRIAVSLWTRLGEPFATLSVNLPDALPSMSFFVKEWDLPSGFIPYLLREDWLTRDFTVAPVSSGMVDRILAYRLTPKALASISEPRQRKILVDCGYELPQ